MSRKLAFRTEAEHVLLQALSKAEHVLLQVQKAYKDIKMYTKIFIKFRKCIKIYYKNVLKCVPTQLI